MNDYTHTPNIQPKRSWRPRRWVVVVLIIIAVILGAKYIAKFGNATITVINRITGTDGGSSDNGPSTQPKLIDDPEYAMPDKDDSRLDILILGIRGKDDVQDGGSLTDTILLFSQDTKTGAATLTSIPRDLTVRVTDSHTEKINTAYIYNGLDGTERLYSRILGVRIDKIAVFDFTAFKSIVDTLGGITITLDKPFSEPEQWGYTFSLPAGVNNLNGDQALYYARSRYGSSDFDRSRRQIQIIMAIKAKVDALHLASDPLKVLQLVTTIRSHIDTDLSIFDLGTLKNLIQQGDQLAKIKRYQITTENILYEASVNGIYELLPRDGTLAHIKEFFQTILSSNPVLPTPIPANASPRSATLSSTPSPSATPTP